MTVGFDYIAAGAGVSRLRLRQCTGPIPKLLLNLNHLHTKYRAQLIKYLSVLAFFWYSLISEVQDGFKRLSDVNC